MNGYKRLLPLAFVAGFLLILAWSSPLAADDAASVTLIYFEGTAQGDGIMLEWATASESETVGFRVERALDAEGPYTEVDTIGFVRSEGDALIGASYAELDSDARQAGATYYYLLFEVEVSGNENQEGPLVVTRPEEEDQVLPTATVGAEATQLPTTTPSPTVDITAVPTPTATSAASGDNNSSSSSPSREGSTAPASATAARLAQLGQEVPTATPEGGYPGPEFVQPASSPVFEDAAYPAPASSEPTILNQQTTSPVPETGTDLNTVDPETDAANREEDQFSVIGQGGEADVRAETSQQASNRSVGTTLLLWVGFFASLLVFTAGVFGSIILYARRRTQDH